MRIDRRTLRRAGRVVAAATAALALAATGAHGQSRAATDAGARSAPGQAPDWLPSADHHMHVWSADARDGLVRLIAEIREGEPPELPTFDGDQAVAQLDAAGIERGVLLSTAYLFGSPDVDFADEREKVRRENDWVARQVAAHPDRLVAFFGVNPLADYAGEVARRCAEVDECTGVKLQLANSDVDFHDEAHVRELRSFFATVNGLGLPVVVHLQTRNEDFGAEEVGVFVDRVLPAAPDVPVQVAHLGGDSRFDPPTRRAVRAFLQAFEDHPDRTRNVFFDMGLVPWRLSRARGDSARRARWEQMNRLFAEAVREIGPDRIVFGTDFPEAPPGPYARELRATLPLTEAEIRDLFDDRAPYLR